MRAVISTWIAMLLAAIVTVSPAPADARGRARVEWTKVEVQGGADSANSDRVAKTLRSMLTKASKKADFGNSPKVNVSAKVVELAWEEREDVVRLSCTVVGRLEGGPSARSRISFGGAPKDRRELEKQVLTMVANGVVTRLAEIARSRSH